MSCCACTDVFCVSFIVQGVIQRQFTQTGEITYEEIMVKESQIKRKSASGCFHHGSCLQSGLTLL